MSNNNSTMEAARRAAEAAQEATEAARAAAQAARNAKKAARRASDAAWYAADAARKSAGISALSEDVLSGDVVAAAPDATELLDDAPGWSDEVSAPDDAAELEGDLGSDASTQSDAACSDAAPALAPTAALRSDAPTDALVPAPHKLTALERFEAVKRRGRMYSVGEEIANAASHGVGAGLAIAGLVILIVTAVSHGGGLRVCAAVMFGVCLVLEYLASTLYHAIQPPRAKSVIRIFDHSAIYLLIAGTYAPFTLVTLRDEGGVAICAVVWAVAILGILLECFARQRQPKWVSALIYLVMGWAIVFKLPVLFALLPPAGMWLLIAGGICYTVGVAFYLMRRVPYMHMVWHLFVLAGSICHFLSVVLYVL